MGISNEVLDEAPRQTKVFICASGRTGSHLLCRAMTHQGIGVPLEYFNPGRMGRVISENALEGVIESEQLRTDGKARQTYIDTLLKRHTANGIFASKIHWGQFASFLDNLEGEGLLDGGHFIRLYREDLLMQAISRHIAWETGRWGIDDRVTTPPSETPRFFDVDLIAGHLNLLAEEELNWRLYFARNGILPLALSYERFSRDLAGTLQTIVDTFHLDLPKTRFDYVDPGPSEARDAQVPPREEIRAHFLRVHQRIVPARPVGRQPAAR